MHDVHVHVRVRARRRAGRAPHCIRAPPAPAQVDALASARTDSENDATRRLKNELLVRMSEAAQGVLVLAATNVPWALDPAVRRRFERRAYRASVPPEVAAPAGPAVPAAARYQREHSSEKRLPCLLGTKTTVVLTVQVRQLNLFLRRAV